MMQHFSTISAVLLSTSALAQSLYAGMDSRLATALLAAELNGCPGPWPMLDLAKKLKLRLDQQQRMQ
jgi:hypothetical protein